MERPGIWTDLDRWVLNRFLDPGELFALAKVGGWHRGRVQHTRYSLLHDVHPLLPRCML